MPTITLLDAHNWVNGEGPGRCVAVPAPGGGLHMRTWVGDGDEGGAGAGEGGDAAVKMLAKTYQEVCVYRWCVVCLCGCCVLLWSCFRVFLYAHLIHDNTDLIYTCSVLPHTHRTRNHFPHTTISHTQPFPTHTTISPTRHSWCCSLLLSQIPNRVPCNCAPCLLMGGPCWGPTQLLKMDMCSCVLQVCYKVNGVW